MLDYEYKLLTDRLDLKRGEKTTFFVFADTVTARSYTRHDEAHGWLGIRFQTQPRADPSEIIIHVRMLDKENVQEQEALGIIGVNLIYAALFLHADPEVVVESLMDNLTPERMEVDMIKFSGPAFATVDNRYMSLQLVQRGLTDAAMFTASGEVVQAAEYLYKKAILVERGSFRPITKLTLDMLECARTQFLQEEQVKDQEVVVLMEMTLKNLLDTGGIDYHDFLARVDLLGALGKTVLISNFARYFRLATYFSRYTKQMCAMAMGLPSLTEIFEEKYYTDLEGGILEAFGRLFKNDLKLYIYPVRDPKTGAITTLTNFEVAPNLSHLYMHLLQNCYIKPILHYNDQYLPIFSREVLAKIQNGDESWKALVPPQVAKLIKERHFFGYQAAEGAVAPQS